MEIRISALAMGRSSEFGIPNAKSYFFGLFSAILNSELLSIESPRNQSRVEFQNLMTIAMHGFGLEYRISNFCPWN